jgi:hypothetical protein
MPIRVFICALAFVLLGSCGRKAPSAEAVQPAAHDAAKIEAVTPTRLEDDALRMLVRGATFRYAYEPANVSESFSCAGGWMTTGGSAAAEGAYDIANGQLCTTTGDQTTCRRIYRHNGNLYANPLAYADRENWALPLVVVRRSSCR